eukprot:9485513-Pyramimonas_sp.AAC.3
MASHRPAAVSARSSAEGGGQEGVRRGSGGDQEGIRRGSGGRREGVGRGSGGGRENRELNKRRPLTGKRTEI